MQAVENEAKGKFRSSEKERKRERKRSSKRSENIRHLNELQTKCEKRMFGVFQVNIHRIHQHFGFAHKPFLMAFKLKKRLQPQTKTVSKSNCPNHSKKMRSTFMHKIKGISFGCAVMFIKNANEKAASEKDSIGPAVWRKEQCSKRAVKEKMKSLSSSPF